VLEEHQVDAITNFASGSYAVMMSRGKPSRWFLYSAAGIKNNGQTIAVTKETLAKDPAFCEAMVDGLLQAIAFTLANPDETVDLFFQQVPEMALYPNAKEFARLGLGLWQHSVEHPESRANGLGWCDPQAFSDITDLCMTYLAPPDAKRPELDQLFTNRFTGKVKLDEAHWAQVRQRVAEFDKVLG
jgi:hypothetical protein